MGVAHELRGPLTALSMNLELIGDLVEELSKKNKTLEGSLRDSKTSVQALTDIISSVELSTRSRIDEDVNFKEVVEFAVGGGAGGGRGRGARKL